MKAKTDRELRGIFEEFYDNLMAQRDAEGNYRNATTHNIWIGFKRWYKANVDDLAGEAQ